MKFFTDENVATSVIHALRKAGFDVKDVKEEKLQGTSDKRIVEIAYSENRIIITHDKDFGAMFSSTRTRDKGIILVRLKDQRPDNVIRVVLHLLESDIKNRIENNLTIVSETQVTIHKK